MFKKKKKENPKKDLIINSIISTVMFFVSIGYGFVIILTVKSLINIPSEEFTPKLVFLGMVLLWLLHKVFMFCIDFFGISMKEAKEAYNKIEKEAK